MPPVSVAVSWDHQGLMICYHEIPLGLLYIYPIDFLMGMSHMTEEDVGINGQVL